MDKREAVEKFAKFFFGESDEETSAIVDDISHLVNVKKRDMLFFEGEEGRHLFFMLSGSIKLFKSNPEGKEVVIRFIEPGDLFAEILLFLKNRYPVNAMGIDASEVLAIDALKLFDTIKEHPEVAMKLIGKLASKSQYLLKMVENLTLVDARERFLNYLRHLKERSRTSDTVTLPVPKGELSLLLGISPETFSRIMKKLSDEGVIEVSGKDVTILSLED